MLTFTGKPMTAAAAGHGNFKISNHKSQHVQRGILVSIDERRMKHQQTGETGAKWQHVCQLLASKHPNAVHESNLVQRVNVSKPLRENSFSSLPGGPAQTRKLLLVLRRRTTTRTESQAPTWKLIRRLRWIKNTLSTLKTTESRDREATLTLSGSKVTKQTLDSDDIILSSCSQHLTHAVHFPCIPPQVAVPSSLVVVGDNPLLPVSPLSQAPIGLGPQGSQLNPSEGECATSHWAGSETWIWISVTATTQWNSC